MPDGYTCFSGSPRFGQMLLPGGLSSAISRRGGHRTPWKKKTTEKYPVTWYMERCLRDLVKRLVLPTTPKCQWASPSPIRPLGTSCLLAHHPSSCRDSWPLASCIFPSGSLYIPSFPFSGLAVFSCFLQPCLLTLSRSLVFIEQLWCSGCCSRGWNYSREQSKAPTLRYFML